MSTQITTSFVKQYSANVQLLVQQMGSRLRGAVTLEAGKVGEEVYMDRISSTEAQKVTTRHGDSPQIDTPHDRRRVTPTDYDWGDLIDNPDRLRTLIDPASAYSVNAAMAMGRAMDEEIIGAMVGTAYAGKTGGDPTTFDDTNMKVEMEDVTYEVDSGSGDQGLTVGKLIHARKKLGANDADDYDVNGQSNLFLAVNSAQWANLLTSTKVNSADYNQVRALVAGDLNQYMGFNIIRTELIPTQGRATAKSYDPSTQEGTGNNKNATWCMAWHRRGVGLCLWEDVVARITERPDKRFSQYIYYRMTLGSVRLEEERIVKISCE